MNLKGMLATKPIAAYQQEASDKTPGPGARHPVADRLRHRRHHRHRHFRADRPRGRPARRPRHRHLLHHRRHRLHVRRAVLFRIRRHGAGRRQRLRLQLRDPGRIRRLVRRLESDPRIHDGLLHRGGRLEPLLREAARSLRHQFHPGLAEFGAVRGGRGRAFRCIATGAYPESAGDRASSPRRPRSATRASRNRRWSTPSSSRSR